jgi:hypothetical protein
MYYMNLPFAHVNKSVASYLQDSYSHVVIVVIHNCRFCLSHMCVIYFIAY